MLIVAGRVLAQEEVSEPIVLMGESWPALVDTTHPAPALSKEVCQIVLKSTTDELRRLINDDNATLALTAAWEQLRRESMTDGVAVQYAPLNTSAAMRFLGLVEGRTKIRPPQEWENAILSGAWSSKARFYFKNFLDLKDRKAIEALDSTRPFRDGLHWKVRLGERQLDIPQPYVTKGAHWSAHAVADEDIYFLLHDGSHGTLHCLEKGRQIPKWRAHVVCTLGRFMRSGPLMTRNWVSTSKIEVAVFTVSNSYCAIEVFDRKSGRNVVRFISESLDFP